MVPVRQPKFTLSKSYSINRYMVKDNDHPSIYIFKPGALAAGQCVPGFLELLLSANVCMHVCVCVCVCVSTPKAMNN